MTASSLLSQLRELGVEIKVSADDRLVIDAPRGAITPELRSALASHKPELLQILKADQTAKVAATTPGPQEPVAAVSAGKTGPSRSAEAPALETQAPSAGSGEISRLEAELLGLRSAEAARRAEVEAERAAAENALQLEQERWRKAEEESARRRAEQEKLRIEAEAREHADEESRRRIADQEIARGEEELKRMRAMEDARRADVDSQRHQIREAHRAELEALARSEAEQAQQRAEAERHYLETQARKRTQEEELRRRAAMGFQAVEEEILRVQARERARQQSAEEAQRLADESAQRRAGEEARRQAEEQARRRAEEESRIRAEVEAKLRAEEAQRREAEDARLRPDPEPLQTESARKTPVADEYPFEVEGLEIDQPESDRVNEIAEWFDVAPEPAAGVTDRPKTGSNDHFASLDEEIGGEFHAVSVPEPTAFEGAPVSPGILSQLSSDKASARAAAVADLAQFGGEESFRHINAAFDDPSAEVRS